MANPLSAGRVLVSGLGNYGKRNIGNAAMMAVGAGLTYSGVTQSERRGNINSYNGAKMGIGAGLMGIGAHRMGLTTRAGRSDIKSQITGRSVANMSPISSSTSPLASAIMAERHYPTSGPMML